MGIEPGLDDRRVTMKNWVSMHITLKKVTANDDGTRYMHYITIHINISYFTFQDMPMYLFQNKKKRNGYRLYISIYRYQTLIYK